MHADDQPQSNLKRFFRLSDFLVDLHLAQRAPFSFLTSSVIAIQPIHLKSSAEFAERLCKRGYGRFGRIPLNIGSGANISCGFRSGSFSRTRVRNR